SPTSKSPNIKNALLFNEFINSSEFGYKSADDDDDTFGDETTSYRSGSCDRSSNRDSDNIKTFTLDKMSFERARVFTENEEICHNTFWEKDDEVEVDSAFSTDLESTSTSLYNESIVLEDAANRSNIQNLSPFVILDLINGQF
ncbi:9279_t:CDS:1, partial [Dentiscutata heterogama]